MEMQINFEGDHDPRELEDIPCQGGALRLDTITRPVTAIMRTQVGTISPDATVQEQVEGLMVQLIQQILTPTEMVCLMVGRLKTVVG